MEKELEIIQIENGSEYVVLDEVYFKNDRYLLLANYSNQEDIMIRKMTNGDDSSLLPIENSEFDAVFQLFIERNK